MDRYRLGTFTSGGKFVTALNLAAGDDSYAPVSGTFAVHPPPENPVRVKSQRRYGGSRPVAQIHDNGSIELELHIKGTSYDNALARLDALIAIAEDANTQYYFEWRPDGATYSTFYEIRGMAWEPAYRWLEYATNKLLHCKLGFEVAPLAVGAPLDIVDDFASGGVVSTTNLVINPSAEGGSAASTQFAPYGNAGNIVSNNGPSSSHFSGQWAFTLTRLNVVGSQGTTIQVGGLTFGKTYTAHIACKPASGSSAVAADFTASIGTPSSNILNRGSAYGTPMTMDAWNVIRTTFVADSTTANITVWIDNSNGAASNGVGKQMFFDAAMIAEGDVAYFDGDSPNAAWTGARSASTSALYTPEGPLAPYSIVSNGGSSVIGSFAQANGQLVPLQSTGTHFAFHTGRGYKLSTYATVTLKVVQGGSTAGNRMVAMRGTSTTIVFGWAAGGGAASIQYYSNAGVFQGNLVVTGGTPAAGSTYWIRMRREGDQIWAEYWTTDPALGGTPASTGNTNLSGAFGATTATTWDTWDAGIFHSGGDASTAYDDFAVEPYTYAASAVPGEKTLTGIPGTAPALVNISTQVSSATPVQAWAAFGWAKNLTGLAVAPFGIIQAESATAVTNLAVTADAARSGGSHLLGSSATTHSAEWFIDPAALPGDDFSREVSFEVFLTGALPINTNTVVAQLSAIPEHNVAGRVYSNEFGSTGKQLTLPSAAGVQRTIRLGTLTLPAYDASRWRLKVLLTSSTAEASTAFDYLTILPSRQRAILPTGKTLDSTYPSFFHTGNTVERKIIKYNLAGQYASGSSPYARDSGAGGQLIEFPTGDVRVVTKFSNLVPDDPTVVATAESPVNVPTTLHFAVTPRYQITRSS